jgi:hypothetical protein
VRRQRERIGGDRAGVGPGRGEGLDVIAPHDAAEPPERARDRSEVRRRRRRRGIEGSVLVLRPGRHHERACRTERVAERLDDPERTGRHRPRRAEGRMHDEDAALRDPERAKLRRDLRPAQLAGRLALRHPIPHRHIRGIK